MTRYGNTQDDMPETEYNIGVGEMMIDTNMEYHWIFKESWFDVEWEQAFFERHGGWKMHTTDRLSNSMLMERPTAHPKGKQRFVMVDDFPTVYDSRYV